MNRRDRWRGIRSHRCGCAVAAAIAALFQMAFQAAAQTSAHLSLKIIRVENVTAMSASVARDMLPQPAFEMPPIFVEGAPDLFFVSTDSSWLCRRRPQSFANIEVRPQLCGRFSTSDRIDIADGHARAPVEANRAVRDWGHSYEGVFGALKLLQPWNGYDLLTVLHGENKNERVGSNVFNNTINSDVDAATCSSGYVTGRYEDCWRAYNAFISVRLSRTDDLKRGHIASLDIGPILWPAMGYRQNGKKTSGGVRQPSLIADQGHIYVFYTDSSQGSDDGRHSGLHVARMSLPKDTNSPIGAAIPYYRELFSETNPSLPLGFSKSHIRDFYEKPGGKASELWLNSWQVVRFAVARVRGSSAFIGVEEYASGNEWGLRFRVSRDLLHWSEPTPIPGNSSQEGWNQGTFHYPVFADLLGQTSNDIDPGGFFLMGTLSARPLRQFISVELIQ
jgi:hypothetical protein